MERIALAREYRMVEWLRVRVAYLDLRKRLPKSGKQYLGIGKRLLGFQMKVAMGLVPVVVTSGFGVCDCRVLGMVDEAFRGEFEILKENLELVEPPLSGMLPNLCLLKINFV